MVHCSYSYSHLVSYSSSVEHKRNKECVHMQGNNLTYVVNFEYLLWFSNKHRLHVNFPIHHLEIIDLQNQLLPYLFFQDKRLQPLSNVTFVFCSVIYIGLGFWITKEKEPVIYSYIHSRCYHFFNMTWLQTIISQIMHENRNNAQFLFSILANN